MISNAQIRALIDEPRITHLSQELLTIVASGVAPLRWGVGVFQCSEVAKRELEFRKRCAEMGLR